MTYWRREDRLLALAHLFMAAEALTRAVLREHLRSTEKTEEALAAEWSVDGRKLEAAARKKLIFRNDATCHRAAKKASDAFEHGFDDLNVIRPMAESVIVKTARYIRRRLYI